MKRSFYRISWIAAALISVCMMLSSCSTVTDLLKEGLDELFAEETTTTAKPREPRGTSATTTADVQPSGSDTTVSASEITDDGQNEKGTGLREITSEGKLSDNADQALFRIAKGTQQIVGTTYDGKKLPQDFYLYRNQLSGDELKAYDALYAGLLKGERSIPLYVPINVDQLDKILYYIRYDRPELFWINLNYEYYYNDIGNITDLEMEYNSLVGDIMGNTATLEKSVSGALEVMASLPNDTERVKYAHDYLTYTTDYVENDLDQVAYSALVQKKSVCAGYSQAFTYLMHKMGIQCAVVSGDAGESHAWCKVILDGDCYALDVTWDDPEGNPPNVYYYDYFNITDSAMSADHTIDSISAGLPVADGTKASFTNYFRGTQYGTDFGDGSVPISGYDYDHGYYYGEDYSYTTTDYDDSGYTTTDYDWDRNWSWEDLFGYYDDSYDTVGSEWWNYFDAEWKKSDWEYDSDSGFWTYYDELSDCCYVYDPNDGTYYCLDSNDVFYIYDADKDEWSICDV